MSDETVLSRQDCLDEIAAIDAAVPAKFRRKQLEARVNAMEFIETHPEFVAVSENIQVVVDWLIAHELEPSVVNFEIAAAAMDAAGLLITEGESQDVPPAPTITLADIEKMPSDLYKHKLRDPKFAAEVEKLLEAASKARPQPIRR
jgi:hypothetical protein